MQLSTHIWRSLNKSQLTLLFQLIISFKENQFQKKDEIIEIRVRGDISRKVVVTPPQGYEMCPGVRYTDVQFLPWDSWSIWARQSETHANGLVQRQSTDPTAEVCQKCTYRDQAYMETLWKRSATTVLWVQQGTTTGTLATKSIKAL